MVTTASYRYWFILAGILIVSFLINITFGSVRIPFSQILSILTGGIPENPAWKSIVLDFRLTKALTCILAGSALATGGLLMQTLFRNPLAGPDVLGLTSGASLAVAVLIMLGNSLLPWLTGSFSITIAASLGAGLLFLIIIALSRSVNDHASLLLIGLMIGALTAALVSILQFTSRASDQQYYLVWTFGSLGGLSWAELSILAVFSLSGCLLAFQLIKPLNTWLLGDQYARSLGINIQRSRLIIIISTAMLTGSVTAFCGPIAFVGLAVPHLTRLLINTMNHKPLLPAVLRYPGPAARKRLHYSYQCRDLTGRGSGSHLGYC